MDYNALIQLLGLAIPAGFNLIHIFQNQDTGATDVVILQRGLDKAKSQQDIIAAWNASKPAASDKKA